MLVRSGIVLVKYWFSITDDEQHLRFMMRISDPLKQWKLSPMDLESRRRWEAYTRAKEAMLERTHIPEAPWWIVEAVDKKKARLNCIHHLLGQIPYGEVAHETVTLPKRVLQSELSAGTDPQRDVRPVRLLIQSSAAPPLGRPSRRSTRRAGRWSRWFALRSS